MRCSSFAGLRTPITSHFRDIQVAVCSGSITGAQSSVAPVLSSPLQDIQVAAPSCSNMLKRSPTTPVLSNPLQYIQVNIADAVLQVSQVLVRSRPFQHLQAKWPFLATAGSPIISVLSRPLQYTQVDIHGCCHIAGIRIPTTTVPSNSRCRDLLASRTYYYFESVVH